MYNPSYLSDKKIFECDFNYNDENKACFASQHVQNKMNNNENNLESSINLKKSDKYQKRIYKTEKHHEQ